MYDTYLEMIQVDDAEDGIRIGFLPIHFDSGTHMIFLQKDIHNITQIDKLCVSGEELSKKSLQGVIVDLLGIEKVEIDVDNILYRQVQMGVRSTCFSCRHQVLVLVRDITGAASLSDSDPEPSVVFLFMVYA